METEKETETDEHEDDAHTYVDRDKIDFDPDDGLLSGTAIDGTSEIPGSKSQENDNGDGDTDDDDDESDE